jgi:hypothetical protein
VGYKGIENHRSIAKIKYQSGCDILTPKNRKSCGMQMIYKLLVINGQNLLAANDLDAARDI